MKMSSLLLLLLVSGAARAEPTCTTPSENHRKLAFIQSEMSKDARSARIWTGSWGAGYGVLGMAQAALATGLPDKAPELYVGAVSSMGAVALLLADPLNIEDHSAQVDALSLTHPTEVDCQTLAQAEHLFEQSTHREAGGRSLVTHGINVVYNLLSTLVLGLAFHRWEAGVTNALAGIVLGEIQIFTQPTGTRDAYNRYRVGDLSATRYSPPVTLGVRVALSTSRTQFTGLALNVSF